MFQARPFTSNFKYPKENSCKCKRSICSKCHDMKHELYTQRRTWSLANHFEFRFGKFALIYFNDYYLDGYENSACNSPTTTMWHMWILNCAYRTIMVLFLILLQQEISCESNNYFKSKSIWLKDYLCVAAELELSERVRSKHNWTHTHMFVCNATGIRMLWPNIFHSDSNAVNKIQAKMNR